MPLTQDQRIVLALNTLRAIETAVIQMTQADANRGEPTTMYGAGNYADLVARRIDNVVRMYCAADVARSVASTGSP